MKQVRWGVAAALAMIAAASSVDHVEAAAQTGKASYYKHGARTANGERFDPHGYTAAHRTLPFGTRVLVTNVKTGQSVIVRINDRGPFVKSRIIDVSYGAAKVLGITATGVASVKIVPLQKTASAPAAVPAPVAAVATVAENVGEVFSLR